MKTAVVTDSNCGISNPEAESLGIFMIPMPVYMDGTFYYEGIDLDQTSFLNHLTNLEEIHTSQPSPADLLNMWERVLAEALPGKVYVTDVRRVSVTQRHAVQDDLDLVSHGMDAAAIKEKLEKNALNSIIFVGIDDLSHLKRGGRITSVAAMSTVLNVKSLLTIGENKIDAYAKARGLKNCEKKLLEAMQKQTSCFNGKGYEIRIGIAGSFLNEADSSDWYGRTKETFPHDELIYDPLTCSISSHVGANAFGMGLSAKITLE